MAVPGLATPQVMRVAASDGEEGSEDSGEDEEDKEDEQEKEEKEKEKEAKKKARELAKEKEKQAKEAAKQKVEKERELLKKKLEMIKEKDGIEDDSLEGEIEDANELESELENEAEDKDELEDEQDEVAKKATEALREASKKKLEIIEDIYEEIFEAAERIEKARLEGVDVTKALATLEAARAKAKQAEASLALSDLEAAKRLAKEVKKLAHFARNKDVHDAREIAKDVSKVEKRITQTEGKIFLLNSLGGDTSVFVKSLDEAKGELAALKEKIAQGGEGLASALQSLETLERQIKRLKSSVENAIFALGGTDEELDDDYKNEVEDFSADLNEVAEIEGDEVETELRKVADDQKVSAQKVGEVVKNIDERNRVAQFLFGAKEDDLEELSEEVMNNKTRLAVLNETTQKVEDEDMKSVLEEQMETLKEETTKLENFISGQKNRLSAFGWFVNLFPF